MKRIILFCALLFGIQALSAQDFEQYKRQANKEYNQYKKSREQEFKEYRDKVNSEYADFMRNAWKSYDVEDAKEQPKLPDPPEPIVRDPKEKVSTDPIIFKGVVLPPVPRPEPPKPIIPIDILDEEQDGKDEEIKEDSTLVVAPPKPQPEPDPVVVPEPDPVVVPEPDPIKKPEPDPIKKPEPEGFAFEIYGTDCTVSLLDTHRFKLKGVDENSVADAWQLLSHEKFNSVVADAIMLRDALELSDWGYFRMLEEMTTKFFGSQAVNEARLMQIFILVQSGYNVRIARANSHLAVLLPFDGEIYEYSFYTLDSNKYYIVDRSSNNKSYFIFDRKFPNEQIMSINIAQTPSFKKKLTAPKVFNVKDITVCASLNQNLMDFYSDYPRSSSWMQYSKASLSDELKSALYPQLKAVIKGMSELDATEQLLSFVQYAFQYKTDDEQFGYERPLFGDETFYYPYSDCEDRSILFSILVRELLGLDVVLLYYNDGPGAQHLATAVKFQGDVNGDYMSLDRGKYVICDPTYVGASVGMAMPQFKKSSATVYFY